MSPRVIAVLRQVSHSAGWSPLERRYPSQLEYWSLARQHLIIFSLSQPHLVVLLIIPPQLHQPGGPALHQRPISVVGAGGLELGQGRPAESMLTY